MSHASSPQTPRHGSDAPPTGGRLPAPSPLLPTDPPKVGDFWLDARLTAAASGIVYLGHEDGTQVPVMVVLLSDGAASDAAARDRFAGEINKMHIDTVVARGGQGQDQGRLAVRFRGEQDDPPAGAWPLAPWAALAYDRSPASVAEADRILASVDLSATRQMSAPSGPDYRLHWLDNTQPGNWRLWPLPWPGRHDRAGWVTIATSWLLMLLMAALALLIAVLIFWDAPRQSPPPPVPTQSEASGSPSPQSGSPSPQSGSPSPSPQSGSPSPSPSPSPSSGSPSPSPSSASGQPTRTPSDSPSMRSPQPSGSESGGGNPTPNTRL